jgi:hypothetical protein
MSTTVITRSSTAIVPEGTDYRDSILTRTNALGQLILAKLPTWQLAFKEYQDATSTISVNNLNTNPWNSSGPQTVQLPAANTLRMLGVLFEFNITLTNTNAANGNGTLANQSVIADTLKWFKRLDVQSETNVMLSSEYPDTKLIWLLLKLNEGNIWSKFELYNINNTQSGFLGANTQAYLPGPLPPFYLPLTSQCVAENLGIYWKNSEQPLNFIFYPETTIIVNSAAGMSGAATLVTLNSVRIIVKTTNLIPRDDLLETEDSQRFAMLNQFLDPTYVSLSFNQSMAPGTVTSVDLSGIEGRIAFLAVIMRVAGSNSNINNAYNNGILTLGERGLIDVVSSANQSLITSNAPWLGKYAQNEIWSNICNNSAAFRSHGVYMLPLGGSVAKQICGVGDGFYFQTSSEKNRLTLNPAAQVQQQDLIVKTNAAAYTYGLMRLRIVHTNDLSAPFPVATVNLTQLQAIFAAIPWCQAQNATLAGVTLGGVGGTAATALTAIFATAAQTIVFTYNTPKTNGLKGYAIDIVSDNIVTGASGSTVQDNPVASLITRGVEGFPTATTNVDINVYGWVFREVMYSQEGRFSYDVIGPPWLGDPKAAKKMIKAATNNMVPAGSWPKNIPSW